MSKIYFLGGLGLDNSIINDLSLTGKELYFIDWEQPSPGDTLSSYSNKLISKYGIDSGSVVIGVSFGGLIALEIAKTILLKKVILVSSFRDPSDLPWFFKAAIKLRLYLLFPPHILKHFSFALNYFFSVKDDAEAAVLKQVIQKTDPVFLNWAIKNILRFAPSHELPKIIRIHGDEDRIIRIDEEDTDYVIQHGGHFMIYNRKNEVADILDKAVS